MESNRQVVIHMNHKDEPRKFTPGSRAPQVWAKADELEPRSTVAGSGNGPAGSAWTTWREVTFGEAGRSVMASEDSTGGTTPSKEKAGQGTTQDVGVRSRCESVSGLLSGE